MSSIEVSQSEIDKVWKTKAGYWIEDLFDAKGFIRVGFLEFRLSYNRYAEYRDLDIKEIFFLARKRLFGFLWYHTVKIPIMESFYGRWTRSQDKAEIRLYNEYDFLRDEVKEAIEKAFPAMVSAKEAHKEMKKQDKLRKDSEQRERLKTLMVRTVLDT